jgi:hypothetical protein
MSTTFGVKPRASLRDRSRHRSFDRATFVLGSLAVLAIAASISAMLSTSLRCKLFSSYCPGAVPALDVAQTEPVCSLSESAPPYDRGAQKAARAACRMNELARLFDQAEDDETKANKQNLLESYKWRQAQECAAGASNCAAKNCYASYLAEFGGSSLHEIEARDLLRRAEQKCISPARSSMADGRYLARSSAGCGSKPGSVTVDIHQGRISWRHELQGVQYSWDGTIDSAGAVTAEASSESAFRASGQYTDADRSVTMTFPDCATGITMRIINKMSD